MNAKSVPGAGGRHHGPRELASLALEDRDGVRIAAVSGEIDISNVGRFEQSLAQLPNVALGLVVDLRRASYIDSSGVALLHDLAVRLPERCQRLVIVCDADSLPRRVLTLTGLDGQIPVVDDVETAVGIARDCAEEATV